MNIRKITTKQLTVCWLIGLQLQLIAVFLLHNNKLQIIGLIIMLVTVSIKLLQVRSKLR
jgi:hypothetical protein